MAGPGSRTAEPVPVEQTRKPALLQGIHGVSILTHTAPRVHSRQDMVALHGPVLPQPMSTPETSR